MKGKTRSASEWLLEWVNREYPDRQFSRPDARLRSYNAVPRGFLPSVDKLIWRWWVDQFNQALARNAFGFPDGNRGKLVVRQSELPWDEFSQLMVDKLQLVKADREAVKADLLEWAELNQPGMDIDAKMGELLRAAGF